MHTSLKKRVNIEQVSACRPVVNEIHMAPLGVGSTRAVSPTWNELHQTVAGSDFAWTTSDPDVLDQSMFIHH